MRDQTHGSLLAAAERYRDAVAMNPSARWAEEHMRLMRGYNANDLLGAKQEDDDLVLLLLGNGGEE